MNLPRRFSDDVEQQLRAQMASGRYASESEVVMEALGALEARSQPNGPAGQPLGKQGDWRAPLRPAAGAGDHRRWSIPRIQFGPRFLVLVTLTIALAGAILHYLGTALPLAPPFLRSIGYTCSVAVLIAGLFEALRFRKSAPNVYGYSATGCALLLVMPLVRYSVFALIPLGFLHRNLAWWLPLFGVFAMLGQLLSATGLAMLLRANHLRAIDKDASAVAWFGIVMSTPQDFSDEVEQRLRAQMATGRYPSENDVLTDALSALEASCQPHDPAAPGFAVRSPGQPRGRHGGPSTDIHGSERAALHRTAYAGSHRSWSRPRIQFSLWFLFLVMLSVALPAAILRFSGDGLPVAYTVPVSLGYGCYIIVLMVGLFQSLRSRESAPAVFGLAAAGCALLLLASLASYGFQFAIIGLRYLDFAHNSVWWLRVFGWTTEIQQLLFAAALTMLLRANQLRAADEARARARAVGIGSG